MLTGKLHRYNHHQGPVAHHHCVELTVSADEHGVVDKGQGREQRRQGESNRSRSQHLTLFSLFAVSSLIRFLDTTAKFLDSLPQFLICSQPTSPGPPLLPLFFITPFPKSLETFLSYQVIVFFSEIRNCGLAIDTFYEYQTKDAYHGKLYKTEFDITTLNTRKSPSLRRARVRHSSCSHKVKAHKAQPQPLLQLRSLRGVWRDLVVIFSLGNCQHFTISL